VNIWMGNCQGDERKVLVTSKIKLKVSALNCNEHYLTILFNLKSTRKIVPLISRQTIMVSQLTEPETPTSCPTSARQRKPLVPKDVQYAVPSSCVIWKAIRSGLEELEELISIAKLRYLWDGLHRVGSV